MWYCVFFFNDTATTEIYTLSLHDALPISRPELLGDGAGALVGAVGHHRDAQDRKSTRLNSSHSQISYAVFCLKKKKTSSTGSVSAPCTPQPRAASSPSPAPPAPPTARRWP